jgi:hypothetical protein
MLFAKPPERTRNAKPGTYRHNKNHRHTPQWQELPDNVRKSGKPQAAKRRACAIHTPATCRPHVVCGIPPLCFFCRSCLSNSVALAGKIGFL